MMLVKAGAPVESTIDLLVPLLEKGDIIIDGGNEWYENTEHREKKVAEKGLMYLGMGVSGGEEGARNGELWQQFSSHSTDSVATGTHWQLIGSTRPACSLIAISIWFWLPYVDHCVHLLACAVPADQHQYGVSLHACRCINN